MNDVTSWIKLKRHDLIDLSKEDTPVSTSPLSIKLKKDLSFQELQNEVRKWLDLPADSTEVIKLRLKDKTLVPLSCLLSGNSEEEPFLMEVCKVYQQALSSGTLPKVYKEAVENKIQDLQKRVQQMEAMMPDLKSRRLANIKQVAEELDCKVQFLDRRIDELAPEEWKDKLRKPSLVS